MKSSVPMTALPAECPLCCPACGTALEYRSTFKLQTGSCPSCGAQLTGLVIVRLATTAQAGEQKQELRVTNGRQTGGHGPCSPAACEILPSLEDFCLHLVTQSSNHAIPLKCPPLKIACQS